MGFWVKEEKPTRFERFKENMKQRATAAYEQRKAERQAYRESYKKARIERSHKEGRQAAFAPSFSYGYIQSSQGPKKKMRSDTGLNDIFRAYSMPGVSQSVKSKKKSKKHKKYSNPYDFTNIKPW